MAVGLKAGPRERVKHEGPWLEGLNWSREVTTASSVEYVYLGDRYGVNSVMVELSAARARAFVTSMRDAAAQTVSMSPAEAVTPSLDEGVTYFSFQVESEVVPFAETVQVPYPEALRRSRVGGEVVAQFVVNTLGLPEASSFKVLRSSNELFTAAVRAHLPRMRFTPAVVQGRPVRQLVQMPFQFNIVH
ncbi:MAG: TonB family protein [Gemmatimonadaceae bacterium]